MSAAFIARETGDRAITMHSELANLVVALTQSAWAHHAIFLDNGCSDNVCIGWARALRMRMLTLLPLMYNMIL
ncbi:hypothetical protein PENSPDRAFT_651429 [Peniophora sp. CONT]|nr:hypothetical protein PENSPDRAFT_651429 [Peniophora sp. CONT]